MVKLIVGAPGSGKTKVMIQMANEAAESAKGEVVFIDVADKHSSMLHRQIRVVHTYEFNVDRFSSLYGMLCGMVSANRDIEKVFIDGLDKIVSDNVADMLLGFLEVVDEFTRRNDLNAICSVSLEDPELLKSVEKFQ